MVAATAHELKKKRVLREGGAGEMFGRGKRPMDKWRNPRVGGRQTRKGGLHRFQKSFSSSALGGGAKRHQLFQQGWGGTRRRSEKGLSGY